MQQFEVTLKLGIGRGPTPGMRGESLQCDMGFRKVAVLDRQQPVAFFLVCFREDRAVHLYPVDEQQRVDRLALLVEKLVARGPILEGRSRAAKREVRVAERVLVGEHAGRFVLDRVRSFGQERLDFHNGRFTLRGLYIATEDRLLLLMMPQGEVRHAALERRQPTQLDADPVQAGRSDIQQVLAMIRPHQPANRPRVPLGLPLAVVCLTARLLGFRRLDGKRSIEYRFRGLEVAFHVRGRQRQ